MASVVREVGLRELLAEPVEESRNTGSFDSAETSLHEAPASLRMTDFQRGVALAGNGSEQGPGSALDLGVVFRKEVGQAADGAGDFGISVVHERHTAID